MSENKNKKRLMMAQLKNTFVFLKNWAIPVLSFFIFVFSIQFAVNVQYNFLPMTAFEPRTSGIRSNHSTNWATTTAQYPFVRIALDTCSWSIQNKNLNFEKGIFLVTQNPAFSNETWLLSFYARRVWSFRGLGPTLKEVFCYICSIAV